MKWMGAVSMAFEGHFCLDSWMDYFYNISQNSSSVNYPPGDLLTLDKCKKHSPP